MKFFKCVVTKPVKPKEIKELKKCAEVKVKCPPKYNDCKPKYDCYKPKYDCYKPVKCYDTLPS